MTNSSNYVAHSASSPERAGSKNKASLPGHPGHPGQADMGRIVKGGRVATIAGCRHLRLGVWRLGDAHAVAAVGEERGSGTAVGEERTIPAPTSPAPTGSGSGRADSRSC